MSYDRSSHLRTSFSEIEIFLPEADRLVSSCVNSLYCAVASFLWRNDFRVSRSPASPPPRSLAELPCTVSPCSIHSWDMKPWRLRPHFRVKDSCRCLRENLIWAAPCSGRDSCGPFPKESSMKAYLVLHCVYPRLGRTGLCCRASRGC